MTASPSPASPPLATPRTLFRLIWDAVRAQKGMVSAILLFGFLETFFSKAPALLIQPLMRVLNRAVEVRDGGAVAPAPAREPDWADSFIAFAHEWVPRVGLGSDGQNAASMHTVIACVLISVLCGVLGALFIYLMLVMSRYFATKIVVDLRNKVAGHILSLPLRYFGNRRMGDILSNLTNDTQVLARSFQLTVDNSIVDPMMILGNAAIIMWVLPEAIWILLLMLPLMALPMYRMGKKVNRRSSKSLQAMGDATESMNQILTGIRTVKAYQLEQRRFEDFQQNNQNFLQRTLRMLRAKASSQAVLYVVYQVGFALILITLGYLVLETPALNVETLTTLMLPLSTTYTHVKRLTRAFNTLMESVGALEGIERILQTHSDPAARGGEPVTRLRGEIEIDNLWFGYGEEPVLRGVSLKVQPGQTVAFVGPSGGGKSTLFDMLMRFHDPQQGRILVDGRDLRELRLLDYRRHLAVVSQQPFLFNQSIRENILCGRPGASQAEIEAAARAANIHDHIVSLPDGYDSLAGERGCNLSGGQMQRITIARAILRNPELLFLDEATSALDSENEELVQRALDELRKGRTSFVIAHRLSTITTADLIVVLERGQIVEQGTHDELMRRGGTYARMREMQS